jgi:hypothetical protein
MDMDMTHEDLRAMRRQLGLDRMLAMPDPTKRDEENVPSIP